MFRQLIKIPILVRLMSGKTDFLCEKRKDFWEAKKAETPQQMDISAFQLPAGFEPATYALRMRCSTSWATEAFEPHHYIISCDFGQAYIFLDPRLESPARNPRSLLFRRVPEHENQKESGKFMPRTLIWRRCGAGNIERVANIHAPDAFTKHSWGRNNWVNNDNSCPGRALDDTAGHEKQRES